MTLAPETIHYPMDPQTDHLIDLGFAIESIAGMPTLKMPEVVRLLLEHNETYLNDTLGAHLPPDVAPINVLHELQRVIPQLPHNSMTRKTTLFYIALILPTIAIVAARFYAKRFITPKQIRREDWACLVALIFCMIMTGSLWAQNVLGHSGRHIWDLSLNDVRDLVRCITGLQVIFVTTHLVVKSAFLVFYYRLCPSLTHKRACKAVATYIVLLWITGMCVDIFQCHPIDWWNHFATARCIDKLRWQEAQGSFFVIADFMILFLPLPAVATLQLKRRERIMLIGLFGLGGFISITSIIRIIALRRWLRGSDFTWGILDHAKWLVVELDLAVMVMCAPALKVILFHHTGTPQGSRQRPTGGIFGPPTMGSARRRTKGRPSGQRVDSDTMLSDAYWANNNARADLERSGNDHELDKDGDIMGKVGTNESEVAENDTGCASNSGLEVGTRRMPVNLCNPE